MDGEKHKRQQNNTQFKEEGSKKNLLIGVTGSVAAIKLHNMHQALKQSYNIKIIVTKHASHFLSTKQGQVSQELKNHIYADQQQWQQWQKRGDPVLHIQLRKWANLMLIAPLSANTLAKITNGICDNLLTQVCRAWDMAKIEIGKTKKLSKRIIVCPSMNTMMWDHPITRKQLDILQEWGYQIIQPISKPLMCGDIGKGAMASIEMIAERINEQFKKIDG